MSLIVWSDAYSIGVPEVDAQHKRLIALLNEFHEAVAKGTADDVVDRVLSDLVNYARAHFATEERLMRSAGYPDYASHKVEHDHLMLDLVQYQGKNTGSGRVTISLDVLWFLWDWLQGHISESDKALGTHIALSREQDRSGYGLGNAPSRAI